MVRVVPIEPPPTERFLGSMAGQAVLTADVKAAFADEIVDMFGRPR